MMKVPLPFLALSALAFCGLAACSVIKQASVPSSFPRFYKEGHRGTRGLMPENTIAAMEKGLEAGANVLEMDVYTTKDGQVLVAHDPYVNTEHSRWADGREITKEEAHNYVWHQMNYTDIRRIDVGSKYYKAFPQQQKMAATMPLLSNLIDSVEAFAAARNLPRPVYNIELKTSEKYDSSHYNAAPGELVEAVMAVIKGKSIGSRYYLQSFDMRPLQYLHQRYPGVAIGFLTDSKNSFEQNIAGLGFLPQMYSPHYSLVDKALIGQCKKKKIRIIPWTVNSKEKIGSLVAAGVDGIITDYPNYLAGLGR